MSFPGAPGVVIHRPDTLFERKMETILWANLKAGWMNQKVETNISVAYNPEHGATMAKANAWYVFTDSWKAGTLPRPPRICYCRLWLIPRNFAPTSGLTIQGLSLPLPLWFFWIVRDNKLAAAQ